MTSLRIILWALSVGVWVFSAGFDGAFLRTLMPAAPFWVVFAYGLNLVADVSNELLAYVFMRLQQDNRRGSKKWRWSFVLLGFELAALYFGTVFSWATIRNAAPDLAPWLQWSAAVFASATLLGLGVAQALLDVRVKAEQSEPQAAAIADLSLICPVCGERCDNQHAWNAHVGWHKRRGNGHESQPERVEVQEEQP
jgi:hypothetical protein